MSNDIIQINLAAAKAFNSSYANLSQPIVEQRSVFMAFMDESMRRALEATSNFVVTHPQIQIGTAGTAVGIALNTAASFVINGKLCAGTANTNIAFPTSLGTQGTGTYCKYLVSMNASGTVTITKGNESAAGTAGTYYGGVSPAPGAFMPDLPQQNCAIGYVEITTTTNAFTAGVGSIAGQSCNMYNLYCMPIYEP